ncbi:MAG TPA: PilZ domain-containing protein [Terriglobales bacterium]|nr:PilZ domain-containing protein [Terriglobales bacterium]
MSPQPIRVERRPAQRFEVQLAVSIRRTGNAQEFCGYAQNVSARGVYFYSEAPVAEGERLELMLCMPAEVTLSEPTPVRCQARVVRVLPPAGGTTFGVAVQLEGHEFLPEPAGAVKGSEAFGRISALHEGTHEQDAGMYHPRTVVLP